MFKKILKKILRIKSPLDAYLYSIDLVDENQISGWAYKKQDEKHKPTIDIVCGEKIAGSTIANVYREDLESVGIGNGKFGFNFDLASLNISGNGNRANILIDGLKANSKSIVLARTDRQSVNVDETSVDEHKQEVALHMDAYSIDRIIGWAINNNSIEERPLVELIYNEIIVGECKADIYRDDLKKAGIGDALHGFQVKPLIHLLTPGDVQCKLNIDGKESNSKPITIHVSEEAFDQAVYLDEFSDEINDFSKSVTQELKFLKDKVSKLNKSSGQSEENVNGAINVAIEGIAELSVRIETIENILTKHFSGKLKN